MNSKSVWFLAQLSIMSILFVGCSGTSVEEGSNSGGGNGTGNRAPVANAGSAQNVKSGTLVTLNGSDSTDADGNLLTYRWSFVSKPDDSSAVLSNPTVVAPSFTPDVLGKYVVQLLVNDELSDSTPATVVISVEQGNVRPTVNAGPDQNVKDGDGVTLNGTGSRDANGDSLTYHWELIQKPTVDNKTSQASLSKDNIVNPKFTADLPGEYVITLQVSDGTLFSSQDTVTIKANGAPTAAPGPCVSSAPPCQHFVVFSAVQPPVVELDGSASSDPNQDPLTHQWSVRDPNDSPVQLPENGKLAKLTFVANLPGTYKGQLQVSDGQLLNVKSIDVIVTDKPTASILPHQDLILANQEVTLTGNNINVDPEGYTWMLRPPGSPEFILQPVKTSSLTFTPDLLGRYSIRLKVNRGPIESDNPVEAIVTAKSVLASQDQEVSVCSVVKLTAAAGEGSGPVTWSVSKSNTAVTLNQDGRSFFADSVAPYVATVKNGEGEFETDEVSITADHWDRGSSPQGTIGHRFYHYGPDDTGSGGTDTTCEGNNCPLNCEMCHSASLPNDRQHDNTTSTNQSNAPNLADYVTTGVITEKDIESVLREGTLSSSAEHPGGATSKSIADAPQFSCRITQLVQFLRNPTPKSANGAHEGIPSRPRPSVGRF